jgi:hypothetical protein
MINLKNQHIYMGRLPINYTIYFEEYHKPLRYELLKTELKDIKNVFDKYKTDSPEIFNKLKRIKDFRELVDFFNISPTEHILSAKLKETRKYPIFEIEKALSSISLFSLDENLKINVDIYTLDSKKIFLYLHKLIDLSEIFEKDPTKKIYTYSHKLIDLPRIIHDLNLINSMERNQEEVLSIIFSLTYLSIELENIYKITNSPIIERLDIEVVNSLQRFKIKFTDFSIINPFRDLNSIKA